MIRTARGRWGVLSPCFAWPVETEYKKYTSLINFLYDDTMSKPAELLSSKKPRPEKRKIIEGVTYLLKRWPQYKQFLVSSPDNIEFVNHQPWTKDFNDVLREAKKALKRFKIKGKEVEEKKSKFEMMGATIQGDEAIFEYDAKEHVNQVVYGISSETELERLNYIGKMISSYLYLFDKIPEFLLDKNDNPAIYYALIRTQPEQIAKILCSVNVKNFKPLPKDLLPLLEMINEDIGYLWPYIVFPVELHSSIKKDHGTADVLKFINYHFEYDTAFKKDMEARLQMLQYALGPKESGMLEREINKPDGTDSDETSSISIETLQFEEIDHLPENVFSTDWVIPGFEEDDIMPPTLPPDNDTVEEDVLEVAPSLPVAVPALAVPALAAPALAAPAVAASVAASVAAPVAVAAVAPAPVPVAAPAVPIPVAAPTVPAPTIHQQQEVLNVINGSTMTWQPSDVMSSVKRKKRAVLPAAPLPPPTQPIVTMPPVIPTQPIVTMQPVIPTQPIVTMPPPEPKVPWEKRFAKLNTIGVVIEPTNPLSPFGTNQVFWRGEKYQNMLAVLYNEAIIATIGPEQLFKNNANKARAHLQAYNKTEDVIIWFKDRGVEILKELVNSDIYKQRKQSMGYGPGGRYATSQLTFLYSRRKQDSYLLEPWIGAIKVDNGIPFHSLQIGGWNTAWTLQQ